MPTGILGKGDRECNRETQCIFEGIGIAIAAVIEMALALVKVVAMLNCALFCAHPTSQTIAFGNSET